MHIHYVYIYIYMYIRIEPALPKAIVQNEEHADAKIVNLAS